MTIDVWDKFNRNNLRIIGHPEKQEEKIYKETRKKGRSDGASMAKK